MPPKKQTFGLIPIPNKIHLSQSLKKIPLERGGIDPSSQKKTPFGKDFFFPNPSSPFLKAPLTTCNFSI